MLQNIGYILLDAARMGEQISIARARNKVNDSLYRGRSEESLSDVAPYIFSLNGQREFVSWYMERGWGDSWGIMIRSASPMEELHKHFRKFLMVKTENGEELYFRFYDPRVLRIFLPTCDTIQLQEFFGPVVYFILEDEDPEFAIRYWLENGQLRYTRMSYSDFTNGYTVPVSSDPEPESEIVMYESLTPTTHTPSYKVTQLPLPDIAIPSIPPKPGVYASAQIPPVPSPVIPSIPPKPGVYASAQIPSVPDPIIPSIPPKPGVYASASIPSVPNPNIPSIPPKPGVYASASIPSVPNPNIPPIPPKPGIYTSASIPSVPDPVIPSMPPKPGIYTSASIPSVPDPVIPSIPPKPGVYASAPIPSVPDPVIPSIPPKPGIYTSAPIPSVPNPNIPSIPPKPGVYASASIPSVPDPNIPSIPPKPGIFDSVSKLFSTSTSDAPSQQSNNQASIDFNNHSSYPVSKNDVTNQPKNDSIQNPDISFFETLKSSKKENDITQPASSVKISKWKTFDD